MSLPRLPLGTDVYMTAKIKDSDVYIDWGTTPADVYVATADNLTAGTVVRASATPNGEALDIVLPVERQQLLNIVGPTDCRVMIVAKVGDSTITYKAQAFTLDPDINEAEAGTPAAPVNIELSVGSATTSAEILRLLAECKAALAYLESNEAERITSEAERNAAELERARRWGILSDGVITATQNANIATSAANAAAKAANDAERKTTMAEASRKAEYDNLKKYSTEATAKANQAAIDANAAVERINNTWTGKQDKLVSGENIKTINGASILGEGNIQIQGGGGSSYDDTEIRRLISEKYTKPSAGIPKSDLASSVQTSLGKADTALQTHQDISGKADKTYVDTELGKKQGTINDLAAIRSGASAGATAVQPSAIADMETKTHASQTYQPKGSYATSAELKSVSDKVDELYDDYATALNLI